MKSKAITPRDIEEIRVKHLKITHRPIEERAAIIREAMKLKTPESEIIQILASQRLEHLRGEIRAERISYGEISELQSLVEFIPSDDSELLQWAGEPAWH